MKTEPTAYVELVRAIALIASFAGVVLTAEDQALIAGGIAAAGVLASVGLMIYNRLKVFSPRSVEKLVVEATEAAKIGAPPPVVEPPGN